MTVHWFFRNWQFPLILGVLVLAGVLLFAFSTGSNRASEVSVSPYPAEVDARVPTFEPQLSITVEDTKEGAYSDLVYEVELGWGAYFFRDIRLGFPDGWGVTPGKDVSDGTLVGTIESSAFIGLYGDPCVMRFPVAMDLFDAAISADQLADTAVSDVPHSFLPMGQPIYAPAIMHDDDRDGLPNGVEAPPSFVADLDLPGTTIARHYGQVVAAGIGIYVNTFWQDLGNGNLEAITVLTDPIRQVMDGPVTNVCTPFKATTTLFGISHDNPATEGDESGVPLLTNPQAKGPVSFLLSATSLPDLDGDGWENRLDNCPLVASATQKDTDRDLIGDVCDPTILENSNDGDHDLDGIRNGGDICPLIKENPLADADHDAIGDECEPTVSKLPTVLEGRGSATVDIGAEPTPVPTASPLLVANEKPVHTVDVTPASIGRSDCPADWLASQSQATGYSICYPSDWDYFVQDNGRGLSDGSTYWNDTSYLLLPGEGRPRAEVLIAYLLIDDSYLFADCPEPEPTTFQGISGTVCLWSDQGLS
ncbi:MAG: thrombospondin type 3 repeat-containing protein, partial [Acidimicrobiales bacterium]